MSVDAATGLPHVMKLEKSLYRFTPTTSDPCVYTFFTSDTFRIVIRYVDDLLLLGGNTPIVEELNRKLMERFTTTDMGDVSLALGMKKTK